MDDDQLRAALAAIEERTTTALGEAMFAGLLIGPLIKLLVESGTVPADIMRQMIDRALLVLEERRHPLSEAARAAVDHARSRFEFQFRYLKARPQ